MKIPALLLISLSALGWAQGGRGPVNREAPVTDVPFDITNDSVPKNVVVTYGDRWQELSGRLLRSSGEPVIGIPFYLADPRLGAIEMSF